MYQEALSSVTSDNDIISTLETRGSRTNRFVEDISLVSSTSNSSRKMKRTEFN